MADRVRDLPVSERPYEKCEKYGTAVLSDAELLSVFLKTGTRQKSVCDVALDVLRSCGNDGSIGRLENIPLEELRKIPGIGRVKAIELQCICEFSRRMWRQRFPAKFIITKSSEAAGYYMEELRYKDTENVHIMMMNTKNVFIGDLHISKGTVNASPVSTREIIRKAVMADAVKLIMIHNHPSGDPTPSVEDMGITEKLRRACELIDITLLDSIIIGDGIYFSLKEKGLMN